MRYPRTARLEVSAAGQQGFALLEVLIGGVILAIAAIGIALMWSGGQADTVAVGDDRVALSLAQEKMEHVRSLGFSCIPVPTTPPAAGATVAVVSGCPDNTDTQAARTYNESPLASPLTTLLGDRYVSRVTQVRCADPVDLTPTGTGCDSAKIITVDILPTMAEAQGVRVEAVVTAHN